MKDGAFDLLMNATMDPRINGSKTNATPIPIVLALDWLLSGNKRPEARTANSMYNHHHFRRSLGIHVEEEIYEVFVLVGRHKRLQSLLFYPYSGNGLFV